MPFISYETFSKTISSLLKLKLHFGKSGCFSWNDVIIYVLGFSLIFSKILSPIVCFQNVSRRPLFYNNNCNSMTLIWRMLSNLYFRSGENIFFVSENRKNQSSNYLYFQVSPSSHSISCVTSCRPFVTFVTSSAGLGCRSFFCHLAWAVDRWSSNHSSPQWFKLQQLTFQTERQKKPRQPARTADDVTRVTKDLQEPT